MILVDEAVKRLNTAGRGYGAVITPWSRRSKHRRTINEIEELVAPLQLPLELRSFWNTWDPGSAKWPCLDGFVPLDELAERYERERPLSPAVLLPIAGWGLSIIWVELGTATHPGGRVFRSNDDETFVDLWSFDLSGFFELLAGAFERELIDDVTGSLHRSHLEALATSHVREHVSALSPRRIESIDRSRYPAHWLSAEGLPADHFAIRGPSHTVAEFIEARIDNPQVRATLHGHYENTICGGPIRGCIGSFRDDTGEIQVFVPLLAGLTGAIGRDGEVELDVLAFAPGGTSFDGLSAKDDMQLAADMGVADLGNEVVVRLAAQMANLDTSIVATGLRPIR